MNLYEILNGAEASELETVLREDAAALPEGVSLAEIKERVSARIEQPKKSSFRWIRPAVAAACLFLILGFGWRMHTQTLPEQNLNETLDYTGEDVLTDENVNSNLGAEECDPPEAILLYSMEELTRMRQMVLEASSDVFDAYADSEVMGGTHSREDLIAFLELLDSRPILKIIDCPITFISYSPDYDQIFVTMEVEGGDWVRLMYWMNAGDAEDYIAELAASGAFADSVLDQPLTSADGRVTVYSETRKPHVSGVGDFLTWYMVVDGAWVEVCYYLKDAQPVDTEEMLADLEIFYLGTE